LAFLNIEGNCYGQMAEGFARQMAPEGLQISNFAASPERPDPKAVEVMAEIGINITGRQIKNVCELPVHRIDIAIALSREASRKCPMLPGREAVVCWDIPAMPALDKRDIASYRQLRDFLQNQVQTLFSSGYVSAILAMKHNNELVLDHLPGGVMIHDRNRIITWFNSAAERITGYNRLNVVGRDCHEVFPPDGLCMGRCQFRDKVPDNIDNIIYPLNITAKDGSYRRIEVSLASLMKEKTEELQGALVCFRDMTEVMHLRKKLKKVQSFHGIIGADDQMQSIYELIGDLLNSECPVLIQGESGTGKELVAGAIHGESRRSGRPFVTVNCGALPEGILESELFGHVRGAFTGAIKDRKGRFELADGGTIFLDEVGELSFNMQVKLLGVLQNGTFERVGGEEQAHVDVRIISATNKNLRAMVKQGRFREDLFYRLCVVPITLPPIRDRRNDIPLLIEHFLDQFSKETNRIIPKLSEQALHCMLDYKWPGNVRELQNALQYVLVKCKQETIELQHLPPEITASLATERKPRQVAGKLNEEQVEKALESTHGNKSKAAIMLGVGRSTLHRFLKKQ
jgi:PAS domain S-box-containing protein